MLKKEVKLQIKLRAFEHQIVDKAAAKIVSFLKEDPSIRVSGPVPLPTKREIFTILRSVHVNKKSREQFQSTTHKRLIVIENFNEKLHDKIKRIQLPVGVDLTVSLVEAKK